MQYSVRLNLALSNNFSLVKHISIDLCYFLGLIFFIIVETVSKYKNGSSECFIPM